MADYSQFHHSIVIMPNGQVLKASQDEEKPTLSGEILGNVKKPQINSNGLYAKSKDFPNGKLGGLLGKISTYEEDIKDIDTFIGAMKAATTIANSTNLTHLQLIRLFPEAQGTPDEYFHLDNAYVSRDIPALQFRETFYDTTATARYYGRLEESKATVTKYDEIDYNLEKLSDNVYTPIEDILRTIINPQEIDLQQIRWGMKYKRNLEALKHILLVANSQGTLGSPADIGANYHSTNRTADEINELNNLFMKTNDVKITHAIMGTGLFDQLNDNTWGRGGGPTGLKHERNQGGVYSFPGITDIEAIVDVQMDDTTMVLINKPNALRLGEGPKMMKRYEDNFKDAEAIKAIDFNQYLAVNEQITKLTRKFGYTVTFDAPV